MTEPYPYPGAWSERSTGDELFATDHPRRTDVVLIRAGSGETERGQVLGPVRATAATVTATNGNTGNGTVTVPAIGAASNAGPYRLRFTDATHYTLLAPDGAVLGSGVTGTAYATPQITVLATAGATAFIAGDSFSVAVARSEIYAPIDKAAGIAPEVIQLHGTEIDEDADTETTVLRTAHVRSQALRGIEDSGYTLADVELALRQHGIYVATPT